MDRGKTVQPDFPETRKVHSASYSLQDINRATKVRPTNERIREKKEPHSILNMHPRYN
jgi:hypothetical protein